MRITVDRSKTLDKGQDKGELYLKHSSQPMLVPFVNLYSHFDIIFHS